MTGYEGMRAAPMLPGVPRQASPSSKSTSTPRTSSPTSRTRRGVQSAKRIAQVGARRVCSGFRHQRGHRIVGTVSQLGRLVATRLKQAVDQSGHLAHDRRQGTVVVEVRGHCRIHGQSYGKASVRLGLFVEDSCFRPSERRERYTDPLDLGGVAILEDLVEVVQHLLDLAVCERRRKATGFGSGDMAVRLQYGTLSSRSATALSGRASDVPGASGRHAPRLATLATCRVGTAVRLRRQPARHR